MFALATLLLPIAAAAPWFQPADSPAASLFKRDGATPDPNSPDWASHYPPALTVPNVSTIPKPWLDKLNSITLPSSNPVATLTGCCNIKYNVNGKMVDGMDPSICSFTAGCHTDTDLFLAPDGVFVLTFDDGPTEASPELYSFLQQNNATTKATHFMIGGNILGDPKGMLAAFNGGGHIAVHTWSHKYTTSLSNEQVVAELGWTMQIIHDLTGGRLPAYWRPPYGDTDNRVRAIAEQVFGMKAVLWNRDTNDWAIGDKPDVTRDTVSNTIWTWLTGSKSPGILALEHELNQNTVEVFIGQYPNIAKQGWTVDNVADAFKLHWYQNAEDNQGPIAVPMNVSEIAHDLNKTAPFPGASSAVPLPSGSMTTLPKNGSTSGTANGTANGTEPSGKQSKQNNKDQAGSGAAALVIPGATTLVAALFVLFL